MYRVRGASRDGARFGGTLEGDLPLGGELTKFRDAEKVIFTKVHTKIRESGTNPPPPPRLTRKRAKRR